MVEKGRQKLEQATIAKITHQKQFCRGIGVHRKGLFELRSIKLGMMEAEKLVSARNSALTTMSRGLSTRGATDIVVPELGQLTHRSKASLCKRQKQKIYFRQLFELFFLRLVAPPPPCLSEANDFIFEKTLWNFNGSLLPLLPSFLILRVIDLLFC